MIVFGLKIAQYQLEFSVLKEGGEGKIYRVRGTGDTKLAKVYKKDNRTRELEEKLLLMVEHPPIKYMAWPLDVIYDMDRQFCGFVMEKLSINAKKLGEINEYPQPSTLGVTNQQKIRIARNICAVIDEVHKENYVFGDFNPQNIGVDKDTCVISFFDTDTFHINDRCRCVVDFQGYVAPELLKKRYDYIAKNPSNKDKPYAKMPLPTFTQATDNFALAVHIFRLLMNGSHPFSGIPIVPTGLPNPTSGDAEVLADTYCFKPGYQRRISAPIPRLETFPQEIIDLFTRAFIHGRNNPKQRPSAIEWNKALERYEEELATCRNNKLHQFALKNSVCPYCEADPEERKKQEQYDQLVQSKNRVYTDGNYEELNELAKQFRAMNGYKDTTELANWCDNQCRVLKKRRMRYNQLVKKKTGLPQKMIIKDLPNNSGR
jgi:Uncharacterized protein with protein kinase and helix-hairpin-helix DNA-binding domains